MAGWFTAEFANHANIRTKKRMMKNDDFHQKRKIKYRFSISIKFSKYLLMSVTFSHSHTYTHSHSLYLAHSLFSLSHFSVSLITLSECNKILSFVSFPFNDAMKYASNACYLPAINVHVSFFVHPLSNSLTLIDSVVYYFMTRWHNTHTHAGTCKYVYSIRISSNTCAIDFVLIYFFWTPISKPLLHTTSKNLIEAIAQPHNHQPFHHYYCCLTSSLTKTHHLSLVHYLFISLFSVIPKKNWLLCICLRIKSEKMKTILLV